MKIQWSKGFPPGDRHGWHCVASMWVALPACKYVVLGRVLHIPITGHYVPQYRAEAHDDWETGPRYKTIDEAKEWAQAQAVATILER